MPSGKLGRFLAGSRWPTQPQTQRVALTQAVHHSALIACVQVYARLGDWDAKWEAGQVPGWEHVANTASDAETGIDVEAFDTAEELETLGAPLLLSRGCNILSSSIFRGTWHTLDSMHTAALAQQVCRSCGCCCQGHTSWIGLMRQWSHRRVAAPHSFCLKVVQPAQQVCRRCGCCCSKTWIRMLHQLFCKHWPGS